LLGIFLIALAGVIINIVLFAVTKLTLFKVLLIISVVMTILAPICNFIFVNLANSYSKKEIIYAKSGKVVYWGIKDGFTDRSCFEMDGVKYKIFHRNSLNIDLGVEKRSDPVANIKDNPLTKTVTDEIMTFWIMGKTNNKLHVWTLYHITTDKGFEFYNINNSGNFMAEDKLSSIKELE